MSYPGRVGRRRVAAMVVVAALVALCAGGAGTASADSLAVQEFGLPIDYGNFLSPTSAESGTQKIRFNLFNNAGADIAPGTVVKLTPRPSPDAAIIPDPAGASISVPSNWAANMSAFADTTVRWNGSGPFGSRNVTLTYDVSYQCAGGGTSCVPSTLPRTYTVNTRPEPPTNEALRAEGNDLVLTWDLSADDFRITDYSTGWSRVEMDGTYPSDPARRHDGNGSAPRGTTSWRLPNLPPDRKYCVQVSARFLLSNGAFGAAAGTPQACALTNRTPRDLGAPTGPAYDDDGGFTLDWAAATDPDGHAITYALEHRDANDTGWSPVGDAAESTSRTVQETEGTWRYRVRATDQYGVSGPPVESEPVVVDKTAPEARATTDPAAPAFGEWFKDPVTVSFADSTDPALPDGSLGSGIKSFTDAVTFDTHGDHTASGRATDRAGNESAPVDKAVKVDAIAPTATIECPDKPVPVGSDIGAGWSASDEGSGLATAAGGSEKLATATAGKGKVATAPAPRDNVGHVGEAPTCKYDVNTAPTLPGAPKGPEFDQDGTFDLTWAEATDPDGDPLTYAVEHHAAHDAGWTLVKDGLTALELAQIDIPEGTHSYRVQATDPYGAVSGWTDATEVKVDGTPPGAPEATVPEDAIQHEGWFKDSVTVSFGGSTDPALADTSVGSGVERYSDPQPVATHGARTVSGTATDRAGNVSKPTERAVKVDALAPKATIECPASPVTQGDAAVAQWSASDEGSGLATDASGSVELDTATAGRHPAHSPEPRDNVRHVGDAATCEYEVNRRPTVPGSPHGPEFDQDGTFGLEWNGSTDADGDTLTYAVEHDDAGDGGWTLLKDDLTKAELALVDTPEGTHLYRVQATDEHGATSGWSDPSAAVTVDGTGPSAPRATVPEDAVAHDGWFKASVTVSFGGSTDPDLADTSLGSGVASYSAAQKFDTSGPHTGRGYATDRVGNKSAVGELDVKVDATPPVVEITDCPTAPILERTRKVVHWTARDAHSGVATATSGEFALDTARPGEAQVATAPTARDNVGYEGSATCQFDVYANTPPGAPGATGTPEYDQDGEFGLTWGEASDKDVTAGDFVKYEVEQRNKEDRGDWTPAATGVGALRFGADVDDGTWRFRVRAVDSYDATSAWVESALVKVDSGKPSAPTASTSPAAVTDDGWFKDKVTVSFGGSSDPVLDDGTAGSGIKGYSADAVFDSTGPDSVTGAATDRAGNVSDGTKQDVNVDADAPTVDITCPTGTLVVGQPAKATWTAGDRGAGLATVASGDVALDTSSPGHKTATAPAARDRVGHETSGPSCTYDVAYKFVGFSAPVNGTAVNAGKTGRTYPVKWRLQRYDGSLVPDADAQALVASMSVAATAASCTEFAQLPQDEIPDSSTGDTSLRYDAAADQFIYNYKAPATAGCYVLNIRNADGRATEPLKFSFTR